MKEHRKQYTISIPYEVLYHLYVHQGLTTKDIAQQFHCSQSTICQRLHDYQIETHTKHIAIPKEALLHDYAEGQSVTALANQYQVSPRTIYNRLRQWKARPTVKAPTSPILPVIRKGLQCYSYCQRVSRVSVHHYPPLANASHPLAKQYETDTVTYRRHLPPLYTKWFIYYTNFTDLPSQALYHCLSIT